MFWEIFSKLCAEKGKSASAVAKELDLSNSTTTKWKNGSVPNGEKLCRIADYFNVSTDYLLERSEFRNADVAKEQLDEISKKFYEMNCEAQKIMNDSLLKDEKIREKDEEIKKLNSKMSQLLDLTLNSQKKLNYFIELIDNLKSQGLIPQELIPQD